MTITAVIFWVAIALIVYTHVGYPLLLRALAALRSRQAETRTESPNPERQPDRRGPRRGRRDRGEGAQHARARVPGTVGADRRVGRVDRRNGGIAAADVATVLDLPRRGKVPTQDAAVDEATGEILAFSDANTFWDPDALRALVRPFADPRGGLRVRPAFAISAPDGANQEGAYWRYENWVRGLESRLGSVTAGNGAIYAVRRAAYMRLDPRTSHDLSFPVQHGQERVEGRVRARRAGGRAAGRRRSRVSSGASGG